MTGATEAGSCKMQKLHKTKGDVFVNDGKPSITIDVVNFKPQIGLFSAVTFGVGCMIGSGIFISPKGALKNSGSIGKCGILLLLNDNPEILVYINVFHI